MKWFLIFLQRFFVLEKGILTYAKSPSDVSRSVVNFFLLLLAGLLVWFSVQQLISEKEKALGVMCYNVIHALSSLLSRCCFSQITPLTSSPKEQLDSGN